MAQKEMQSSMDNMDPQCNNLQSHTPATPATVMNMAPISLAPAKQSDRFSIPKRLARSVSSKLPKFKLGFEGKDKPSSSSSAVEFENRFGLIFGDRRRKKMQLKAVNQSRSEGGGGGSLHLGFGERVFAEECWGQISPGRRRKTAAGMKAATLSNSSSETEEPERDRDGDGDGDGDSDRDKDEDQGVRPCGCFGKAVRLKPKGQHQGRQRMPLLPDDVVEMFLARAPFATMVRARLVCKKWRALTMTSHFEQLRRRTSSSISSPPWLLLFGLSKDGAGLGQIQALDPVFARWHSLPAVQLSRWFLYSVATVGGSIYILGGRTSEPGTDSLQTCRDVLIYNPLMNLWTEASPMHTPRAAPIVGVFQIQGSRHNNNNNHTICYSSPSDEECAKDRGIENPETEQRCILIVVGGEGTCNEPLNSVEVYDPAANRWRMAASVAPDFGTICAGTGVVCNNNNNANGGNFYVYSDTDKLAVYSFEHDVWTNVTISYIPARLHEYMPRLVACGHRVFLLGVGSGRQGGGGGGRRNVSNRVGRIVWEFDAGMQTWVQVSRHPDAPLDLNAVFVSGSNNEIFGVEMFKIFGRVLDFVTVCNIAGPDAKWERVVRVRMPPEDIDASSCITKTAALLHL